MWRVHWREACALVAACAMVSCSGESDSESAGRSAEPPPVIVLGPESSQPKPRLESPVEEPQGTGTEISDPGGSVGSEAVIVPDGTGRVVGIQEPEPAVGGGEVAAPSEAAAGGSNEAAGESGDAAAEAFDLNTPEGVIQATISGARRLAAAMAKARDVESARAQVPELQAAARLLESAFAKEEQVMSGISPAMMAQLQQQYMPAMLQAIATGEQEYKRLRAARHLWVIVYPEIESIAGLFAGPIGPEGPVDDFVPGISEEAIPIPEVSAPDDNNAHEGAHLMHLLALRQTTDILRRIDSPEAARRELDALRQARANWRRTGDVLDGYAQRDRQKHEELLRRHDALRNEVYHQNALVMERLERNRAIWEIIGGVFWE